MPQTFSHHYIMKNYQKSVLTDTNGSQKSNTLIRRIAFRKERFAGIYREGERHNCLAARSDDDTLNP